jgi:hypothetical protein
MDECRDALCITKSNFSHSVLLWKRKNFKVTHREYSFICVLGLSDK